MDEDFQLQLRTPVRRDLARAAARGDRRHLREGQLAREDDAAEAAFLQREDALQVVGNELRRGVELQRGEVLAHELRDAEVLHDQPAGPDLRQPRQRLDRARELILVQQRVERDVDATPLRPRVGDQVRKFRVGEVLGERARGEVGQPAVDGIRARVKRRERRLEIPRRGQQFRRRHASKSSVAK